MRSVAAQIWPRAAAGEGIELYRSHHPSYADGGQLRDFVYVKDASAVVAGLAGQDEVAGLYNLGSGRARSFKDLADAVFAAQGALQLGIQLVCSDGGEEPEASQVDRE